MHRPFVVQVPGLTFCIPEVGGASRSATAKAQKYIHEQDPSPHLATEQACKGPFAYIWLRGLVEVGLWGLAGLGGLGASGVGRLGLLGLRGLGVSVVCRLWLWWSGRIWRHDIF